MKQVNKGNNTWGKWSKGIGIASIVLFMMPYFGLPLAITAIVFGSKQCKIMPTGHATTGKVTGIIGIIINSMMILLLVLVFGIRYLILG